MDAIQGMGGAVLCEVCGLRSATHVYPILVKPRQNSKLGEKKLLLKRVCEECVKQYKLGPGEQ